MVNSQTPKDFYKYAYKLKGIAYRNIVLHLLGEPFVGYKNSFSRAIVV